MKTPPPPPVPTFLVQGRSGPIARGLPLERAEALAKVSGCSVEAEGTKTAARKFDPACLFLLDMGADNLFEPMNAAPGAYPRLRCKGCGAEDIAPNRSKAHWEKHRAERDKAKRKAQLKNLEKARAAQGL